MQRVGPPAVELFCDNVFDLYLVAVTSVYCCIIHIIHLLG